MAPLPGVGRAANVGGLGLLDDLSRAAGALDRSGLSAAGTQLQKHGSRAGSAFPAVRGNPAAINRQAQDIVDDLLTAPGTTTVTRHHARFGNVHEIRAPDGRGLRYGADGELLGFLEP
jgi:filamentous hemagglutinin